MSVETPEELPQDWFFTFGGDRQVAGISLGRRFVRFHGTYMEAREQMLAHFGRDWCAQYEAEDDVPHGLTELVLPLQEATR